MFARRLSSIYAIVTWLFNVAVLFPAAMFGMLGVTGRLADVSVRENMVIGGVFLYCALAAAVNVVSIPQKAPWRSRLRWAVYLVNSGLLLLAGVGWWRSFQEHQLFVFPPPASMIPITLALMSLCASHTQLQWNTTKECHYPRQQDKTRAT